MKTGRLALTAIAFFAVVAVPVHALLGGNVKAWEGTITLPTYALADQDPNPHFTAIDSANYYPYSAQDNLGVQKADFVHRAFFLENEYLKVTCLPDIGGRIYSVLDKSTGQDMFYRNAVIRPALYAMRGAWISGGIEWNAGPTSHGATSFSPVSVVIERHDKGAASLVIGATDQILRTEWQVRLTLHPGRSYLDESMVLYNPTDTIHTFYFWNNTAFPEKKGSRFIFPMALGTDHGQSAFFNWPIHEGKDLSYFENYDRPSSIFAYHGVHDFFGGYSTSDDRGTVQCGDHNRIGGKKAWTFGQAHEGLVAQESLTDDGSRYVEIQSGPSLTQGDLGFIGPRERRFWQEWWYPVHGLGDGFEYATKDLAIQTQRTNAGDNSTLTIRAIASGVFNTARITVRQGGHTLLTQAVDLSPEAPCAVETPVAGEAPIEIAFADRAGVTLAAYASPLHIPPVTAPEKKEEAPQPAAVEEEYLAGTRREQSQDASGARTAYLRALAIDPQHIPSLVRVAQLDIEAAQYTAAIPRLETALSRDDRHGWAWYYLAVARKGQHWAETDSLAELRAGLDNTLLAAHLAAQEMDTAFVGMNLIGRIHLMRADYPEAINAFEQALRMDPNDKDTRSMLAWARFANADRSGAQTLAEALHREYPLDPLPAALLAELGVISPEKIAPQLFGALGEDEFAIMEASITLASNGLVAEAYAFLSKAVTAEGSPLAARPEPHYLLQHLELLLGKNGEPARWAAVTQPDSARVFPARPEMAPVLEHAASANPADAAVRQYLGNLYASFGRLDDAEAQWRVALSLDSSLHIAARNLGALAWKQKKDLAAAQQFFVQALKAQPGDDTLYRDAGTILLAQDNAAQTIELLQPLISKGQPRADAVFVLVRAYIAAARYDDALSVFDTAQFSNPEGDTTPQRLFAEAHMKRGRQHLDAQNYPAALADFEAARTYPENLGVGKPAVPHEAEMLYWIGRTYDAMGDATKAREAYTMGAKGPSGKGAQDEYREKCRKTLEESTTR